MMARIACLLALVLAGCRPPSLPEMAGAGLSGAALFALTSWALLAGVARVWARLHTGRWPGPQSREGLLPLSLAHLALTVLAVIFAPQPTDFSVTRWVWSFAAPTHLAWSVGFWRLGGRLPLAVAVALASVPCLLLAVPGGLGNTTFSVVAMIVWFGSGMGGLTALIIILLVWLEAWVRREHAFAE